MPDAITVFFMPCAGMQLALPTFQLKVRLIYYPPYHSKYHGIERYWGGLERAWNGYLLASVAGVLLRASQFVGRAPGRPAPCAKVFTGRASNFAAKRSRSLKSGCRVQTTCHGGI